MTPRLRKLGVTAHVTSALGWLGADLGFLALALVGLASQDAQLVRAAYLAMEVIGRVLIHVSPEPITFMLGVGCLFLHKQIQATEIGHTALHGAYDKLDDAAEFQSKTYSWDTPIDEESWRLGHNVKHHGNTNVAGRDPDIEFGSIRLTEQTPHDEHHRLQVPFALFVLFPNFGLLMNTHFTGLSDVIYGKKKLAQGRKLVSLGGAMQRETRRARGGRGGSGDRSAGCIRGVEQSDGGKKSQ